MPSLIPRSLRDSVATFLPLKRNRNPISLEVRVCNQISLAVSELAKDSGHRLVYAIDPNILERVVGRYLREHPTHDKPRRVVAGNYGTQCRVHYYDLMYGIDLDGNERDRTQGEFKYTPRHGGYSLVDGKMKLASGELHEGEFAYESRLKTAYLKNGKITMPSGQIQEGKREYVSELKAVHLKTGTITLPSGEVQQGTREYIPELKQCRLVEGKWTDQHGNVEEGEWDFISNAREMKLMQGKKTFKSGLVEEGRFYYFKQLNESYLVDGKATHPTGEVEHGRFEYIEKLEAVALVQGVLSLSNGDKYTGTFKASPGMNINTHIGNGSLVYADGRSEQGEFTYVPELKQMKLIDGITRNSRGETVKEGRRSYVPEKGGVYLMEGLAVFPDGVRQMGVRNYIPELNEVLLTAGTIINGSNVQSGTWAYSECAGGMVFKAAPLKEKLPPRICDQIKVAAEKLLDLQRRFDLTGKFGARASNLQQAATKATLAQTPEQFFEALGEFTQIYKKLTRELSLVTHPDKIQGYVAHIHGEALQQLAEMRGAIDEKVLAWQAVPMKWY